MQPSNGVRIVMRLVEANEQVKYALELEASAGTWRGDVSCDASSGDVAFSALTGAPAELPPWILQTTRGLVRTLWRAHRESGWPRRITRWRAEPEERAP